MSGRLPASAVNLDGRRAACALLLVLLLAPSLPAVPAGGTGPRAFGWRDGFDQSPDWTVVEGAWRYHDGLVSGSGRDARLVRGNASWTDVNITGRFKVAEGDEAALLFRVSSADHGENRGRYYQLSFSLASGVTLYRVAGSAVAVNTTARSFIRDSWYDIKLRVNGSYMECSIDSAFVLNETALEFPSGCIGLKARLSACQFDDIEVRDFATGALLLSDGFGSDPNGGWQPSNGTWSFSGGLCQVLTAGDRKDFNLAPVQAPSVIWTARLQLRWSAGTSFETGLYFNVLNTANCYFVHLSASDGTLRIQRTDENGPVPRWAQTPFPVKKNEWYTLSVVRNDTEFRIYVNSVLVLTKVDANVLSGSGFALGSLSGAQENVSYSFIDIVEGELPAKPDLLVDLSSLAVDPPRPNPGEEVSFAFAISNAGNIDAAGNIAVEVLAGDIVLVRTILTNVPAGGETPVRIYWTTNLTGVLELTFAVDREDQVPELDETNNREVRTLVVNIPPVPSFVLEPDVSEARVNDELVFNGSASRDEDGAIAQYLWEFGDGTAASVPVARHRYQRAGNFRAVLTVKDDWDTSRSADRTILIRNREPSACLTWSPSGGNITTVFSFGFTLNDPDDTLSNLSWEFGDGAASSLLKPSHQYRDDGRYFVSLVISFNSDRNVTRSTRELRVENLPPSASILSAPAELGKRAEGLFRACATDPDDPLSALSFLWSFGDGSNGTGAEARHSYERSGTFQVNLTVRDDDGAVSTVSAAVRVANLLPVPAFAPPAPDYAGSTFRFDASASRDPDGSISSFAWDFGDGEKGAGAVVDHAYSYHGNFTVNLTVTDDEGGKNSTTAVAWVREVPEPPPPGPSKKAEPPYLAAGLLVVTVAVIAAGLALWSRARKGPGDEGPPEPEPPQGPGGFQG